MILVAAFWGTQFCLEDTYCRGRLTWHSSDKYNSRTLEKTRHKCHMTDNSYTMAVRDLLIYTPKARGRSQRAAGVYIYIYQQIPSSRGISDIYHLGRTHLIGERTNENSSRLFYTVASEDRSWF